MSVSTSTPTLGPTWISLGNGPLFVEVLTNAAMFAFSDSQPGPDDRGFVLSATSFSSGGDIKTLSTTSQIWARAGVDTAQIAYAPISAPASTSTSGGTTTTSSAGKADFSNAANSGLLAAMAA